MQMKNYFSVVIIVVLFSGVFLGISQQPVEAQGLSATDFLPPTLAASDEEREKLRDVSDPASVEKVQDDAAGVSVTTSPNPQDAVNTLVKARKIGCEAVRFPSGLGWVASGVGEYRIMDNPTATLIARRNAYVVAYTQAKTQLAQSLNGLSTEAKTTIRSELVSMDMEDDAMAALKNETSESIEQAVQMLLRGFVVYDVYDDTENKMVWVSVVTSPRTRGQNARPSANAIDAASFSEGINAALAEIQSGIVPPVGGRIITVRGTDEIAFVGFGSSIIRTNENAAMQAKMNLTAERVAQARASDALCGVIIGDDTRWKGQLDETTVEAIADFEEISKDDPLAKTDTLGVRKLEQTRSQFVNVLQTNDEYESIRKGALPPGVTRRSWTNDELATVFAVAVYVPSLSNQASSDAEAMRNANPIGQRPDPSTTRRESGAAGEKTQQLTPGPSGQVQQDSEL